MLRPRRRGPCWVRRAALCHAASRCIALRSASLCDQSRWGWWLACSLGALSACLTRLAPHSIRPPTGLSLPQAQVLGELFGGRGALLDPPRPATIKSLIAFQAHWDRHPQLYSQICQVGGWVQGAAGQGAAGQGAAWMGAPSGACSCHHFWGWGPALRPALRPALWLV